MRHRRAYVRRLRAAYAVLAALAIAIAWGLA